MGSKLSKLYINANYDIPTLKKNWTWQQIQDLYQSATPLFMIRRLLSTEWYNGKPIVPLKTRLGLRTISALPNPEEIKFIRAEGSKLRRQKREEEKEDTDRWVADGSIPS